MTITLKLRSQDLLLQFAGILEDKGVPPAVAGLGVLVAALISLDTFNQTVLGDGVLNNPSNALAFAAAGKGVVFSTATVRIVGFYQVNPTRDSCSH